MKRSYGIRWAMVLGILGSFGCGDSLAPTEPGRGAAEIASVMAPPSGLSGTWSGTITFFDFHGNNVVLPCDGTAPIGVTLNQDGTSLTGRFQSGCAGELEIRGQISGSHISGTLNHPSGKAFGRILGTVSSDRIQFETITFIAEDDDGAPGRDPGGDVLTSEVVLHPLQLSERTHPLVVDSGHVPRSVAVRR